MAQIELAPDALIVHITGADRLWVLRSHLEIPLDHVTGAEPATKEERAWLRGLRLGSTHVPGVLSVGQFYQHGDLVFWDVHDPDKAIAISLAGERNAQLIIEVENPIATIDAVMQTIQPPVATR